MVKVKLSLCNDGKVVKETVESDRAYIAYHHGYLPGDYYMVTVSEAPAHVFIQLDASLTPAYVYLTEKTVKFAVPFNLQREWPYPDAAFSGRNHYTTVRVANTDEIAIRRNLAQNSHDMHDASNVFPHATANAETRGEFVFFARNAIDGYMANESHGNYPFQSWGINQREDAELTIDFGRPVNLDQIGLTLRADYPHDTYWVSGNIHFSDGSTLPLKLVKSTQEQQFKFATKQVSWIKLGDLVRAGDTTMFPALTQLTAYGTEIL